MKASQDAAARLADAGPRYRILKVLGEGSFGVVYRARLSASEQEVALKALTRVKPDALARFKREFRALCEVNHPNLVGLRELFEHEDQWFIAMDLVEGTDLLSWVRRSANDNDMHEARIRKAFADVAQGLAALHAHGLLHRDLKPSNVRVTPEGKAILLDFGLVTMADAGQQSTQRNGVGTLAYMAPEQMSGEKLSPAADLYALGASLYQALTGRVPHEADSAFALMLRKANEDPPPPRRLAPHLPFDLDGLCMALLERDARLRPALETVLRGLLGVSEAKPSLLPSHPSAAAEEATAFEGRDKELARLKEALLRTHEGELSVVFVEGESGIGKSALIAEFVRRQLELEPRSWVLSGRCYEHERVPYKAFDVCIDALAKRLGKLTPQLCSAVLPRRAGLLSELFPVLGTVKAVAESHAQGAPAEPTARRLSAFAALADLLGKLAESRPLIVVIDDLQWADEESLRLLRHLVCERPAPILLLASVRPDRELSETLRRALAELRKAAGAQWISLRGLPLKAITTVARQVLGPAASARVIDRISYESDGHPMLVTELCYYAKAQSGPAQRLSLDAALTARLNALTASARKLLEPLALCGRPHREALFQELQGVEGFADVVKELLAARFARRGLGHTLAIAHDRMRGVVLAQLEPESRQALHRKLAEALEAKQEGEPSELAEHWERAGQARRAAAHCLEAAKLALQTLAFGSAAEHYERAFVLLGDDASPERGALLAQQGRAFGAAGKSAEAARAFMQAAERVTGADRVRLHVLAAQHELQSAQFDQGVERAAAVLGELGIPLPRTRGAALGRIVWERALLALRGTKVKLASEFDATERLRLDAMTALSFPLWWADFLPGNALTIMHVRRALSLGEPGHAAVALAQEATLRAMMLDDAAVPPLFALATELAERSQLPSARARVLLGEGVAASMRLEDDLCLAKCSAAEEMLVNSCPEEPWLLTNVRTMIGLAWAWNGQGLQHSTSLKRWLAEARERRDVFAEAALIGLGYGFAVWLVDDRPADALDALERSLQPWQERPGDMVQMAELSGRFWIHSYAERSSAHAWFGQQQASHNRSFLLQHGQGQHALFFFRALAALSASAEAQGSQQHELVAKARASASAIRPRGMGGMLFGRAAQAQVSACAGQPERALALAREAAQLAQRAQVAQLGRSIEYLIGVLEGGDAGKARCEAALAFFREQGWKDPWRAATLFAPAARILEGERKQSRASSTPPWLGRYRLSEPLPAGEGEVLVEALDVRTGRTCTLRVYGRTDPAALPLLKEELRAQEQVHHANWARIEALYEHEGRLIVALEALPKTDLGGFVRTAQGLDFGRLRLALAQALAGLGALHETGACHGELRTEFLRVGDEGRLVLLGRGSRAARAPDRELEVEVDELDYLAPERLQGAGPSPAADVYALGTVLYQALTEQLPFAQLTAQKVHEAKLRGRAVPPWALRIEVPSELEELCLAMLERDPALRPSLREAEARLSGSHEVAAAARTARRTKALASLVPESYTAEISQRAFIGRNRELALLASELTRAEQGRHALVCVRGEGGIGKTALVSEALEQLRLRAPQTLVLSSRCYANEQLRFQAFEGAVDELARWLSKLPAPALETLLPARAVLLAQLFPALASVPAIRGATKKGVPAEPVARRAAALEAFVELLVRVSKRSPLVLVIDDLQWADAESFVLLEALLRDGGAGEVGDADDSEPERTRTRTGTQGLGLAIVAMLRPGEARDEDVRAKLVQLSERAGITQLTLEKLRDADALLLARRLFGPEPQDAELLLAVRESGGHPLFLQELAQARRTEGSGLTLSLEQALLERVATLDSDARGLLERLALLARPCPAHVLERAAGLGQAFDEALRGLLRATLIQRRGPLGLACFHDRLREVVATHVAPERVRQLCAQLAEALAAEAETDPAEQARLWDTAGEHVRACSAYAAAGDRALAVLSFAAAERLYARALELSAAVTDAPLGRLLAQRGHAFVALGRSADAAAQFERAAQHASGAEAIRLRVLAAQHQLQSLQFEQGMGNARSVLKELGAPLPTSNAQAFARIVWERSLLGLRGTRVSERKEVDEQQKLRLDAMDQLFIPVSWVDFVPSIALNMGYLRQAVRLGEPSHAARALAQEAMNQALMDAHEKSRSLLVAAETLAGQSHDAAATAWVAYQAGNTGFIRAELGTALARCLASEEALMTSCPAEVFLLNTARITLGLLLFRYGDFARLASSFRRWFADAEARRDAFMANGLFGFGFGHVSLLMEDRLDELAELHARLIQPWRAAPPSFPSVGEMFVQTNLGRYVGGGQGYEWLREHEAEHRRSFLMKQGEIQLVLLYGRTMAALCARAGASAARQGELLAEAARTLRGIRPKAFGAVFRPLAQAQVEALEGHTETALGLARRAQEACVKNGDEAYRQSAVYLEGVLEGGEIGRARCEQSLAFYRERGWKDPWRGVTMWAPAVRELEGKS